MRKSIVVLMLLFVAITAWSNPGETTSATESSVNAEMTSSENSIIGTWEGKKFENGSSASYTYIFYNDGSGFATFNANGRNEVTKSTILEMNMSGELKFHWKKENSTITINASDLKMNITEDDLIIISDNPQEKATFDSQKSVILDSLNSIFKDTDSLLRQYSLKWDIKELSKYKLIVIEKEKIFEFYRVE